MATFSYEPFFFFLSRKMVQQCGDFAIYFQKQKGLWKKKPHLYIFISFGEIMICWWAQWSIFFGLILNTVGIFGFKTWKHSIFAKRLFWQSYVSLIGLKFIPKKLWIMSIILLKIQIHTVWWPSLKDKQPFLFITTLMLSSHSDIFSISFH